MARAKVFDKTTNAWIYADESFGQNGESITITNIVESPEDGGSNVVTFSDGNTLTVKNGRTGTDAYTPQRGIDYYTDEEKAEFSEYIASELAKRGQLKPEYAKSIEECTDTSKMYVLPDGYIYAYTYAEVPAYTNVLTTAVDVDDTPYNGGLGYKEGYRYSTSSGEIANAGTCVTGYIPVKQNDVIRIKNIKLNITGPGTICFFNPYQGNDKVLMVGTIYTNGDYGNAWFDDNGVYTITPETASALTGTGVNYFRITADVIDSSTIITINEEITDETVKEYAWASTGHAFVPADYEDRIVAVEQKSEENANIIETLKQNVALAVDGEIPEVILPNKLYAVVGHEFVLYYDNILRCMIPENFIVTTVFENSSDGILSLAPQYDRMLKFTPTDSHIGTHSITIKVISRRTWETVATKDCSIEIVADTARTNKKVLFIGDSLTEASTYVAEIERMSNGGIVSIGTISRTKSVDDGTVVVKSEGRSGWGSYDYMNDYTGNGFTNPFYNPDKSYQLELDKKYYDLYRLNYDNSGSKTIITHNFDFAYYVTNAGVGTPDAVFLNLGTNGGNLYAIESVYVAFDAMIERIRAYSKTVPVFLYLFPPTSRKGDSARTSNGIRNVNVVQDARTGYYDCIKLLIDRYDNDERVIIVPTYTMLDTLYDYKTETVVVSARCAEQVTIGDTDSTHPAKSGYLHMADSFYNVLQYVWGS